MKPNQLLAKYFYKVMSSRNAPELAALTWWWGLVVRRPKRFLKAVRKKPTKCRPETLHVTSAHILLNLRLSHWLHLHNHLWLHSHSQLFSHFL